MKKESIAIVLSVLAIILTILVEIQVHQMLNIDEQIAESLRQYQEN